MKYVINAVTAIVLISIIFSAPVFYKQIQYKENSNIYRYEYYNVNKNGETIINTYKTTLGMLNRLFKGKVDEETKIRIMPLYEFIEEIGGNHTIKNIFNIKKWVVMSTMDSVIEEVYRSNTAPLGTHNVIYMTTGALKEEQCINYDVALRESKINHTSGLSYKYINNNYMITTKSILQSDSYMYYYNENIGYEECIFPASITVARMIGDGVLNDTIINIPYTALSFVNNNILETKGEGIYNILKNYDGGVLIEDYGKMMFTFSNISDDNYAGEYVPENELYNGIWIADGENITQVSLSSKWTSLLQ